MLDWGREVCGDLAAADRREWLCTNGLGGFASGTVAGGLARRYHGLLVAALQPPLGRTLVVAKLEEDVDYGGAMYPLATNHWADGTVAPGIPGSRALSPRRHHAGVDVRLRRRPAGKARVDGAGANATYVAYRVVRAAGPAGPHAARPRELSRLPRHHPGRGLAHGRGRGGRWAPRGRLRRRRPAGLDPGAGGRGEGRAQLVPRLRHWPASASAAWTPRTTTCTRGPCAPRCVPAPHSPSCCRPKLRRPPTARPPGPAARRAEADLLARCTASWPGVGQAPAWVRHLVLASDQFHVARRPLPDEARRG